MKQERYATTQAEKVAHVKRAGQSAAAKHSPATRGKGKRRYVRLPLPVLKFLLGIAPLEGVWFGEKHPKKQGLFWWRSAHLWKVLVRSKPLGRKGG